MLIRRSPHRATSAAADPVATDLLRLRAAAGLDLGDIDRLSDRSRRALAVARSVGAPLLGALEGAAAAELDERRASRAIQVASAQTRAVAAGLLIAPLVLVPGLGRVVGADLVGFYTTPAGALVGVVGVLLLATGAAVIAHLLRQVGRARHTSRTRGRGLPAAVAAVVGWVLVHPLVGVVTGLLLLRRRTTDEPPPAVDEVVDLVATALSGGVASSAALRAAAEQRTDLSAPLHRLALDLELGLDATPTPVDGLGAGPAATAFDRLGAVLTTATAVGAPAVPALRRLAADLRADDLARVLAAAERLPVRLAFPTALCLLPATLLLAGAPIVHAGLAATGST